MLTLNVNMVMGGMKTMVGNNIKRKRKELGLTLKELSTLVNISVSFLSDIENGRSNPSLERLKGIAEGLGCTVSFLIGEINSDNKEEYYLEKEEKIKEEIIKLLENQSFIKILNQFEGFETWCQREKEELFSFLKVKRLYKNRIANY